LRADAAVVDLSWIDDFWAAAGSRVFVRAEDGVLILPPNRVYRANPTAVSLVSYLKRGGSASRLSLPTEEARRDTADFFGDLAALYRGEEGRNGAISSAPYDFSFTRLPVLAELALTYRCNNACRFCYAGCGPGADRNAASRRPELDTAGFRRIIRRFAEEAKVPFFSFTGGEPTLRLDLERLIRYARSLGLATNLVTNGTLVDRARARSLSRAGLGSAQVSLEGPDAALHDDLVGRPGAFAETLRGIRELRAAGVPTQTNTTITAANASAAPLMPAFLASVGVERFAMNLFIPTAPGPESDRLFVSYEEIGPVVDAVAAEAKRAGLVFYWYSPTPYGHFNPISRGLGNKSCAAADGLLSVAPDGAVLPCSSWDESLGNLYREDFGSIWFAEAAAFYKSKSFAPAACASCPSFVACQGACPLYRRYLGLGADDPSPCDCGAARSRAAERSLP